MLGQGAAQFVRDRLLEQSDEYRVWICQICGIMVPVDKNGARKECPLCGCNKIVRIKIPYGAKLVVQELMGMNIIPRILVDEHGKVRAEAFDDALFDKYAKKPQP